MKLDSLFKIPATNHGRELFSPEAVAAIEAALSEKNGKPYIRCLVF